MSTIAQQAPNSERNEKNAMADQSAFWWGLSVDIWDTWGLRLMIAGALFGVAALIASLASSFILYKTGNVFQAQVATAHDNLKLETARLSKEADTAHLEAERIKGVVAWRAISDSTIAELMKVLAQKPGSVNLRYTDGDPEALFLAIQLSNILVNAKWRVAPGALKLGNALVFGVALPDGDSDDGKALRSAFEAAQISFSPQLPTVSTITGSNISTIPGAPMLMVGSRLPPSFPKAGGQ